MTQNNKVIAIAGPTASGKTSVAIKVAKALNTEIISADSRQIYTDFETAVAKPSQEETEEIEHHMIGIVRPDEEFTVANFADEAKKIINRLHNEGKIPVVAGGTGLYFRILLENFDLPRVEPDKELRAELEKLTVEELYRMLQKYDPIIAQKIHPNNTVKIIRALEVCKTLNIPMSEAQQVKEKPDFDVIWFGLNAENRDFLYNRINQRVDIMIENGLENEAREMFKKYANLQLLFDTIGYKEFYSYFKGEISYEQTVEAIKQNTRRYAKRQLTWFRRNKSIKWFDIEKMTDEEIAAEIVSVV